MAKKKLPPMFMPKGKPSKGGKDGIDFPLDFKKTPKKKKK